MNMKLHGVFLLVVFLAACQDDAAKQDVVSNDTNTTETGTTEVQIAECITGQNLIANPEFVVAEGQVNPDGWGLSQHSGEPSFDTNIDSGVLTITKVATQPWFTFTQKFDAKEEWAGRRIRYSADLKLDLSADELTHQFEPGGGLYLLVYGDRDPIGGDRLLLDMNLKHEPKLGVTDWKNVAVDFTMPEKPTRLLVGFMHQATGSMAVRNPVLSFCEE